MSSNLISVIVPVYNTEKFLSRCIDSVLRQKNVNVELILVNDGSTDSSGNLCDEYAKKNSKVKAFHKKNEGAAASRNFGVQHAKGDFVLFLDSDDIYLTDNAIDILCETAVKENSDLVCFNYSRIKEGEFKRPISSSSNIEKENIFCEKQIAVKTMIERNVYTSSSCLKLIRRQMLTEILFNEKSRCEDIVFCFELLVNARHPIFVDECLYGYTVRDGSTTQTYTMNTVNDTDFAIKQMLSIIENNMENDINYYYKSYIAFQYCTLLINIHLVKPKIEKTLLKKIYSQKEHLNYHANKIVWLVWLCSKLLGIGLTSRLLTLYFKKNG